MLTVKLVAAATKNHKNGTRYDEAFSSLPHKGRGGRRQAQVHVNNAKGKARASLEYIQQENYIRGSAHCTRVMLPRRGHQRLLHRVVYVAPECHSRIGPDIVTVEASVFADGARVEHSPRRTHIGHRNTTRAPFNLSPEIPRHFAGGGGSADKMKIYLSRFVFLSRQRAMSWESARGVESGLENVCSMRTVGTNPHGPRLTPAAYVAQLNICTNSRSRSHQYERLPCDGCRDDFM